MAGAGAARTVRRGKGAGAAKAVRCGRRQARRSGGRGRSGSSARGKSTTTPTSAGSGNQDPVLRRDMVIKGRLRYAQHGWK